MKNIDRDWIQYLHLGGIFLGSGGGGDPESLSFFLNDILTGDKTIRLISLEELDAEGYYASVNMMGSPELMGQYFPAGVEGVKALERLQALTGQEFKGITTIECAGVNILYPMLVAGRLGLPVVDADSMGRAFPELQMTTFNFAQIPGTPLTLIDSFGREHDFFENDNFLLELNTRKVISEGGGVGFFAGFSNKGSILKHILIPGTISFAAELGQVFANSSSYSQLLEKLIFVTKNSIYGSAIELFTGSIKDIETESLSLRTITIKGSGSYINEEFKILMQNENLFAYRQNKIAAMVPDLISVINLETLRPVNNNNLLPGMEVSVIGTPAPLPLKTKKNLDIVGPQCFGYKSGYEPLEKLYYSYYY